MLEFNPLYTANLTRTKNTDYDSNKNENENISDTSSSNRTTANNGTVNNNTSNINTLTTKYHNRAGKSTNLQETKKTGYLLLISFGAGEGT